MGKHAQSPAFQKEHLRQRQLLRTMLSLSAGASLLILIAFLILWLIYPGFPWPLVMIGGAFLLTASLSLLLLHRDEHAWAIGVYLVGLTLISFAAVYFAGGVRGPITVVLISIPVVAGLLGERQTIRWVILIGGLYLTMASLEALGVIQPQMIGGTAERITYYSVFMLALIIIAYLVTTAAEGTQRALVAEEERSDQLAEANLQLERAAQAETALRLREEQVSSQLRVAVARYSDYLSQVAAGNYQVGLAPATELVDAGEEAAGPVEELAILGHQIEDTVQALVGALDSLQQVQRRYVQESWAEFARTGFQRDYRYGQGLPGGQEEDQWLASLEEAVRGHQVAPDGSQVAPDGSQVAPDGSQVAPDGSRVAAAENELALPIALRGELLGAIGLRREGGQGWSEAELALAETISDQLAQTMESLRLLDQTQRRAARDRLVGELTRRMRETLDIETVLQTTADELFKILDADEVTVRLGAGDGDRAGDE